MYTIIDRHVFNTTTLLFKLPINILNFWIWAICFNFSNVYFFFSYLHLSHHIHSPINALQGEDANVPVSDLSPVHRMSIFASLL